jgi:hypothetical protein
MKSLVLALLFLLPLSAAAATPVPAEYDVVVHIQSTALYPAGTGFIQRVAAVIGGKKFELMRFVDRSTLRIGDYKAKIVEDKPTREEEYTRTFEFLFKDGKTARFFVTGESE